jgi:hypothetical protein
MDILPVDCDLVAFAGTTRFSVSALKTTEKN